MRIHAVALIALASLVAGGGNAMAAHRPTANVSVYSGEQRPSGTAASGNIGVGAMLGEPTGVSLKSWSSGSTAFDLGLTYAFGGFFELLGDYLWHFPGAFPGRGRVASEFVPYVGLGAEAFFDTASGDSRVRGPSRPSNAGFGARVPVGLEWVPHGAPLGVFGEVTPGLALAPSVFAFLEGGVGARFYF